MAEDRIVYPFTFPWRSNFDELFLKLRVFLKPYYKIKGVYKPGELVTIKSRVLVEPYSSMTKHGFFNCGAYSYSWSQIKNGAKIGRYTSIAGSVSTMGDHHPIDRVSTSIVSYSSIFEKIAREDFGVNFRIEPFDKQDSMPPEIGNDVWIGEGVLLRGGIKVGDGAVIAARSVVTRDVPPYSIVAGVPATVKRMRFSEKVVEQLRLLEWWKYNFFDLPSWSDVSEFIDILSEKVDSGAIVPYAPQKIDIAHEIQSLLSSQRKFDPEYVFINLKSSLKKMPVFKLIAS